MPEELKPCPFCGGKAYIGENTVFNGMFYACCCDCSASAGDEFNSKEEAIAAWNTRTQKQPLTIALVKGDWKSN